MYLCIIKRYILYYLNCYFSGKRSVESNDLSRVLLEIWSKFEFRDSSGRNLNFRVEMEVSGSFIRLLSHSQSLFYAWSHPLTSAGYSFDNSRGFYVNLSANSVGMLVYLLIYLDLILNSISLV